MHIVAENLDYHIRGCTGFDGDIRSTSSHSQITGPASSTW